ncbi:MAG: flagellar basal body rod protein FlgC [Acidimicrobiia bacterium]
MGMFGVFQTSQSALTTYRTWLDAISDNISNINTVRPMDQAAFQARTIVQDEVQGPEETGGGVRISRVALGDPEGIVVHDPNHPLADANGNVRHPNIDLGEQMANMLVAQRSYQANVTVIARARELYQQAMGIGK